MRIETTWLVVLFACGGKGHSEPERFSTRAAAPLMQRNRPLSDEQPYVLTISGGVSLGAYEAGLNWAAIELMRRHTERQNPRLLGVTGASAGSINALLTAMQWCGADESEVEDNLFSEAWRPIGFGKLLPTASHDYLESGGAWPQDLLLSRKSAFKQIIQSVRVRLASRRFRDCDLKMGFTVTSKSPRTLKLRDLRVSNQRFVIPLRVRAHDRMLHFYVDASTVHNPRPDLIGNLLLLEPSDDWGTNEVSSETVIQAALASSAYPVAFGPVTLTYCTAADDCGAADSKASARCVHLLNDADAVACKKKFIDGGVFDNVPLGVAMAQIEADIPADHVSHRPVDYLYMYPGNRRLPRSVQADSAAEDGGGTTDGQPLSDTIDFLHGAVATASDYELHNVLRYNYWNAGTPSLAEEVAKQLDDNIGRGSPNATVISAFERVRLVRQLRRAAKSLRDISISPSLGDDAAKESNRLRYTNLREETLEKIISHCSRSGAAKTPCGPRSEEIVVQAEALQHDARNERRLTISGRFSPIAGTHITHFGAFFDRPFRDYDYYAGVYDALRTASRMTCDMSEANAETTFQFEDPNQSEPTPSDVSADPAKREECEHKAFVAARDRLGIEEGPAFAVTEALWNAEVAGSMPAIDGSPVSKTMAALLDPRRCVPLEQGQCPSDDVPLKSSNLCLADRDIAAFACSLTRARYRTDSEDSPFLRWLLDHPGEGWWALPASYAAARLVELADRESVSAIAAGAPFAATYIESYVDQRAKRWWVVPSSLPEREFNPLLAGIFPFVTFSGDSTRRMELGLYRFGLRLPFGPDDQGLARLGAWDFLIDASSRLEVRPRLPGEKDTGTGFFTRGTMTYHLSFAPTLRLGGVLTSVGWRGGIPISFGPFESIHGFRDELNAEVVATFLGDKIRAAVGCHPAEDLPPNAFEDPRPTYCFRDMYLSLGINDLAGFAYWTGLNPLQFDRLLLPFFVTRTTPDLEIGLVRGGWQWWDYFGLWADSSLLFSSDTSLNASVAVEAHPTRGLRSVGLRSGLPLLKRDHPRYEDSNAELILTGPYGLGMTFGTHPFDIDEDGWLDSSYVGLIWDFGSLVAKSIGWIHPVAEKGIEDGDPFAPSSE